MKSLYVMELLLGILALSLIPQVSSACGIFNCIKYSEEEGVCDCAECREGFSPWFHECQNCSELLENCKTCGSRCFSCMDGYYLSDESFAKCKSCSLDGCKTCSGSSTRIGTCTECKDGFYPDNYEKISKCSPCTVENCKSCSSDGICQKCKEGFYSVGNPISDCLPCADPNCKTCTSMSSAPGTCIECKDYLYPDNPNLISFCSSCMYNKCKTCKYSPDICDECKDGLYPDGSTINVCSEGVENCKYAQNGKCTECQKGYLPDNNENISHCFKCNAVGCSTASADNKCSACQEGLLPSDEAITECGYGGANCKYARGGNCIKCADGYLPNGEIIEGCYKGPEHCIYSPEDGWCTKCEDNYLPDYYFDDGRYYTQSCTKTDTENCVAAATNGSCTKCINKYYVNGNSCIPCSSFSNECNECDKEGCLTCETGFYVNENKTCSPCAQGCETCSKDDFCLTCLNKTNTPYSPGTSYPACRCNEGDIYLDIDGQTCVGYGSCSKGSYNNDTLFQCLPCDSSCATCDYKANNCLTCADPSKIVKYGECVTPVTSSSAKFLAISLLEFLLFTL